MIERRVHAFTRPPSKYTAVAYDPNARLDLYQLEHTARARAMQLTQ